MERLLLFEYATCGAFPELDPSLTVEGLGMFKALLEGVSAGGVEVETFIDPRLPHFPELPRTENYRESLRKSLEQSDLGLVIAPESGMEHYRLTRGLEESGTANLGSGSEAVYETSDKYRAYRRLRGLPTPRTEVFRGRGTSLTPPLIAKPRDGTSGEGLFLIERQDSLNRVPEGYLLQEYLPGRACSASLLVGDEVRILSLNTQEQEGFSYRGAKLPLPLGDCEVIHQAVERFPGLFGYVGVDFVWDGEGIQIIEINARPTTPLIALERALNVPIMALILKNHTHETLPPLKAERPVHLKKVAGGRGGYVSYPPYSLILEELREDLRL
jgi:predicted ATP-grasp superfamily ATP-dependent carboligase